MGLFDIFKKQVNKDEVVKELTDPSKKVARAIYQYLGSKVPIWKEANTTQYVTNGYNINQLVYAIIQWKAQKCAMIDFEVVEYLKGGKYRLVEDHPVLDLLENPNKWQGKQEFFEQFYGFKFIDGNSYIYTPFIENGVNKGKLNEMHVLPAPITEIVTGSDFNPIGGYIVRHTPVIDSKFEANEIMHSRYANYDADYSSYVYGVSPMQAAWRLIQKSNSNNAAAKSSFDNMGALGVLFQKDTELARDITDEQRKKAQYQLDRKVRGTDNKGRIINTIGDYGYINFGANPVDLALIEDARMTREELCTVFHVDPALFGAKEASSFNNMKEARKVSFIDGVLPEVQGFADEFNRHVMPAYGKNLQIRIVKSNIPELQADLKEMSEWLSRAYWLKENEKREAMGYKADSTMDVFHIPANLLPQDGTTENIQ